MALCALEYAKHVVGERGKVGHAIVDVGRFVDADKRLVEDCEQIAEQLQRDGLESISSGRGLGTRTRTGGTAAYLLDDTEHHCLISLSGIQLEKLLEICKGLGAFFHLIVNLPESAWIFPSSMISAHILNSIIPSHIRVENLAKLFGG